MKKYLLLFLSLGFLSSCELNDDDAPAIGYDYASITSVALPETFEFGETYEIKVTYTLPSSCHETYGFEYEPKQNTHFFGMIASYPLGDPSCSEVLGETEEFTWRLPVNQRDLFIFKFWTGIDEDGTPIFITKEIEVREPNT